MSGAWWGQGPWRCCPWWITLWWSSLLRSSFPPSPHWPSRCPWVVFKGLVRWKLRWAKSCDILPAVWQHVDVLSKDFSQHVCHVQPAFQRNVDIDICHTYFCTFVMSCGLLSKLCRCFVLGSMKKYWWRCQKEKSKKSHETVLLNDL